METTNSGRGKRRTVTPEEIEHDDSIEECEEENLLERQFGHIPGRLPNDWGSASERTFDKEISLDHATKEEWKRFLDSLEEEE
jgi:hypothetical protein